MVGSLLLGLYDGPGRSEPTIVPTPFLCQRKPATTQSAVRVCLTLTIVRSPARYGASRRLAMTPSSPAPSKRRNQSVARARSRVAGDRGTGDGTPANTGAV